MTFTYSVDAFENVTWAKIFLRCNENILWEKVVDTTSPSKIISFDIGKYLHDIGDVIKFNINKRDLWNVISSTDAFLTSGCSGCNRPYYTSRPSGPTYNYPRVLNTNEKEEIFESLINLVQKV